MTFHNPEYLWLAFGALIPWIVFLFFHLNQSAEKIPSLIFIRESGKRNPVKRPYLIYLFQSLAIILLSLFLSFPTTDKNHHYCFLDDTSHTRLTSQEEEKIQQIISSICKPLPETKAIEKNALYSLSALSSGKIIETDLKKRRTDYFISNIINELELLEEKTKNGKFIFFVPENNFLPSVTDRFRGKILFHPIKNPDPENNYFIDAKLRIHRRAYNRRILTVTTEKIPRTIQIVKNDQIIFSGTPESTQFRWIFDAQYHGIMSVKLTGDSYIDDNTISFSSPMPQKIYYVPSKSIPDTIASVFQACDPCSIYLFQPFKNPASLLKNKPHILYFAHLKDYQALSNRFRDEPRKRYVFIPESDLSSAAVLPLYSPVKKITIIVKTPDRFLQTKVHSKYYFNSGDTAAGFDTYGNLIFFFDPDSPAQHDRFHPVYADMLFDLLSSTITEKSTENETRFYRSTISGKPVPKKYQFEEPKFQFLLYIIPALLFLVFIFLIFLIEKKR